MEFLNDGKKKRRFFLTYGVFLFNGMLALSVGSLLPFIRDARGLEYTFCGLIVSLHSVGNLISSFGGGLLPLFIGRKRSILFFESFFVLAYLLILFTDSNICLALAFLMTGLARGAASNFCNASVNELAPGKAWTVNCLHGMFSVGAFIFPILLALLTRQHASGFVCAVYLMLAVGILGWIMYAMMPLEQGKGEGRKGGGGFAFFREPLFYLCSLTLFFYLCAEQGVIGWMVAYFKDTGLLGEGLSQITASVLWIMILAGRLTTAWVCVRVPREKLLPLMGVGLVFFFVLLILSRSSFWIVAGIMGFGYSMAGIYPTTVSFTGHLIQEYPMAWNFILTFAGIGSIVMPSVIGSIAERTGIAYGMGAVGVALVIDLALILGLSRYMTHRRKDEKSSD